MTKATDAWKLIEPFAQQMMDDLLSVGARRGSVGEYPLLLYDGDEIIEFAYSAAGMTAAISASASGDVIFQPAGTISGDYTNKSGVTIFGQGKNSILSGTITNNGILNNVNLAVSPHITSSGLFINVIVDTGNIINGTVADISNAAGSTTDYNVMAGGTNNTIDTGGTHGPNATDYNFIGGGDGQYIQSAAYGAVVGGYSNEIFGNYSFIGGGYDNTTYHENDHSVICGGVDNQIGGGPGPVVTLGKNFIGGGNNNLIDDSIHGTIVGGWANQMNGNGQELDSAFIGGGDSNEINNNSDYSAIVGGERNVINAATHSIIAGGLSNDILPAAHYAFASGRRAQVAHRGAMLFAGSIDADFNSAANDEFAVRAYGGLRFITFAGSVVIDLNAGTLITSGDTATVPFTVKGKASQSANLTEWKDSSGNVVAGIDERGVPFCDLNTVNTNYFAGNNAGDINASGALNIGIGDSALEDLTSGTNNIVIGDSGKNITTANNNILIGKNVGNALTVDGGGGDGTQNVGMGSGVFQALTTGYGNFGFGGESWKKLVGGDKNVGIGFDTASNIEGTSSNSMAIGFRAMKGVNGTSNVHDNIAIGAAAMQDVETGSGESVAIGSSAGKDLDNGEDNVFIGYVAGQNNAGISGAVFIGNAAGQNETTDNTLYIANTNTATPLIYGEFDTPLLKFHGSVQINPGLLDYDTIISGDNEANLLRVDAALDAIHLGDWDTNYTAFAVDGTITQVGTARIDWTKIVANNITQGNGTHSGTTGDTSGLVGDITVAHDGNFYHIDEAAADPGFELTVEFISVTAFNWVQVLATYDGANTHPVQISLYNFSTTTWDVYGAFAVSQAEVATAGEYTLENKSFFVPSDTNYIGTDGDAGDVRVRIRHTVTGNPAHDIDIDVVALYH